MLPAGTDGRKIALIRVLTSDKAPDDPWTTGALATHSISKQRPKGTVPTGLRSLRPKVTIISLPRGSQIAPP